MRPMRTLGAAALALALACPAHASFGSGPGDAPATPPPADRPAADGSKPGTTARQEADRWYHDAYGDIQKATADLAAGKRAGADKRYRRALERGERAIALDSTYHEAWNLVGYAARKLKEYDRAVAAYQRCLRIKPGYAPAREYLGETYVELGRIELAREQLAALDGLEAPQEARTLKAAIEAWEKAHPAAVGGESGTTK